MKQHITVEQLNELSEKGKEKLKQWYDKTYGTILYGEVFPTKELVNPLFSIGQMIEFLENSFNGKVCLGLYEVPSGWSIKAFINLDGEMGPGKYLNKKNYKELCDALWEAVKEVLEK